MKSVKNITNKIMRLAAAAAVSASIVLPQTVTQVAASEFGDHENIKSFSAWDGRGEYVSATGGNCSSENIYTWTKVTSSDELRNIVQNYNQWYGGEDGMVPIIIVIQRNGKWTMIQSSGDNNAGLYNIEKEFDNTPWDERDDTKWSQGASGVVTMENRTSRTCYREGLVTTNDVNGLNAINQGYSSFITRGNLQCFYLKYDEVQEAQTNGGVKLTYDYEIYTSKLSEEEKGDYVPTDRKMCVIGYSERGYSNSNAWFRSYTPEEIEYYTKIDEFNVADHWNFDYFPSENGFEIQTSYYSKYGDSKSWMVRNKCRFAVSDYALGFYSHQNWEAFDYEQDGEYTQKSGYQLASGSQIKFAVYYGVPGTTREVLSHVDGTKTVTIDKNEDPGILRKAAIVKNGAGMVISKDYSIPSYTSMIVPYGTTLTIEEGRKLIVGRNSVLIVNGRIENKGEIIVQPGGTIDYLDPNNTTMSELDNHGFGKAVINTEREWYMSLKTQFSSMQLSTIAGGNIVIRKGGKMRVKNLASTKELYCGGLLIVDDFCFNPEQSVLNSAVVQVGYHTGYVSIIYFGTNDLTGGTIAIGSAADLGALVSVLTLERDRYFGSFKAIDENPNKKSSVVTGIHFT